MHLYDTLFKAIFHIYCNICCHNEAVIETAIDNTVQKYLELFTLTDFPTYAAYFNKEKNSIRILVLLSY